MRYLSVCSGIEAATVAWHPLGWECVGVAEIDPFACSVLKHHYPSVRNYGNLNDYASWDIAPGAVDVLVGGTPCQSFSFAGLRKGIADPRGNLALVYLGLVDRIRPRYLVWENVPGVLSSGGGRDFGAFLGALVELGYGFAYRVLDAQWVRVDGYPRAVPQRRKRVFVVGCAGADWQRAAEVLLEPEGVRGNPPTRRKAWEGAASRTRGGAAVGREVTSFVSTMKSGNDGGVYSDGTIGTPRAKTPHAVAMQADVGVAAADVEDQSVTAQTGYAITAGKQSDPSERDFIYVNDIGVSLPIDTIGSFPDRRAGGVIVGPTWPAEVAPTIDAQHGVAFDTQDVAVVALCEGAHGVTEMNITPSVQGTGGKLGQGMQGIRLAEQVRRLTPRECERLQGFPDDYTLVAHKGKPAADGNRYKAIGNSMAVNVMRWIGTRIDAKERA